MTHPAIPWQDSEIDQLDGTYVQVETADVHGVFLTWMGDRVHAISEQGEEEELAATMEDRDEVAWMAVAQLTGKDPWDPC